MRIENDNNVRFGAHFKNNEAFKRVFAKTSISKVDKTLVDTFSHQPNHEIEILSDGVEKFTGRSYYTLFNNTLGSSIEVGIKPENSSTALNELLKAGINLVKCERLYKSTTDLFNNLTSENK